MSQETIVQLRNIRTQKPYSVPMSAWNKMQLHHKAKFEIVGQLEPLTPAETKPFVPDAIEAAVERMQQDQPGAKASPTSR